MSKTRLKLDINTSPTYSFAEVYMNSGFDEEGKGKSYVQLTKRRSEGATEKVYFSLPQVPLTAKERKSKDETRTEKDIVYVYASLECRKGTISVKLLDSHNRVVASGGFSLSGLNDFTLSIKARNKGEKLAASKRKHESFPDEEVA